MPSSDYTTTGGGLKLKGAKEAGIDKKRKTKKAKPAETEDKTAEAAKEEQTALQKALAEEEKAEEADIQLSKEANELGKTEAQKRHEERRRKRLDERLKREGIKTHKERVEELNKYLSNLSEHHDMPRIGPG